MNEIVLVLAAAAGCLLQSTLIRGGPLDLFTPDTALILVISASFALPFLRGILTSFCLGLLTDLASGAPEGANALLATVVFLLGKGIQARMFFRGPLAAGILLMLAFALKPFLFAGLFPRLRGTWLLLPALWTTWLGELVATLVCMPLVSFLLPKGLFGEPDPLAGMESPRE